MAGIQDCWTAAKGCTATLGNFGASKLKFNFDKVNIYISHLFSAKATYAALAMTYSYLTPDLWKETVYTNTPFQLHSAHLATNQKKTKTAFADRN